MGGQMHQKGYKISNFNTWLQLTHIFDRVQKGNSTVTINISVSSCQRQSLTVEKSGYFQNIKPTY